MGAPLVTIVVGPRERFSYTFQTVEYVYAHTKVPFEMVCVDGNSPPPVRAFLEEQARVRGITVVRTERYLIPNEARNLGLAQVKTPYVVFLDNDVAVAPGWLDAMLACAEATGAAVVTPLTCIGQKLHQKVHIAGGELRLTESNGRRRLHERMRFVDRPLSQVRPLLTREPTQLVEFHCFLARTDLFERLGPFDEQMFSTREHIDFSLAVQSLGEPIYFEPEATVTFVQAPPFEGYDLHYFMLRWSDAWEVASLRRFCEKWGLDHSDDYFQRRYRLLGWRRKEQLIQPLLRRFAFGKRLPPVEALLVAGDRVLNRVLTDRFAVIAQKATG
jgi:GT2 family glycosyltransferase